MNWKAKLAAYLHDPPHKPVGIQHHEQERGSFLNRFGLPEVGLVFITGRSQQESLLAKIRAMRR